MSVLDVKRVETPRADEAFAIVADLVAWADADGNEPPISDIIARAKALVERDAAKESP